MPLQLAVVEGATIKCDKGTTPSFLIATTALFVEIEGKQVATIADHLPVFNVLSFGICSMTQKPCFPVTPLPWQPGGIGIPTGSRFPILPKNSILGCVLTGVIEIQNAAQSTVFVDAPPVSKDEVRKKLEEFAARNASDDDTSEEDKEPGFLRKAGGFLADITPIVGTAKGIGEAIKGEDLATGEELSTFERGLGIVPYGKVAKKVFKGGEAGVKAVKGATEEGGEKAGKLSRSDTTPLPPRPANSPNFSVAHEARLQRGTHYPGLSDRGHFAESNRQLST